MTHLWEVEHDYYGPEGSYWANGIDQAPYINRFDSWFDYTDDGSMFDSMEGLNFLYRWDWMDYREDHAKYGNEDGEPDFVLQLFWMMPRKGIMAHDSIVVTEEDEPAVREFLTKHWEYMKALWAPLEI